jgi:tight adherence protein C
VQKALFICIERKREDWIHPLYAELARMQKDMHNGYSFAQSMEQFGKRCSLQEVSMFVTTVLINQRRGGDTLVLAMQDVARQLWEKRKSVARRRGEEASTKLIFPMMLMFLVILVVVGAPALLMMK